MDLMTKLGGRKFLMALAVVGAAMYLEVTGKGLTPTMAGFLVGIVGMFSAANFASSAAFMKNKGTTTSSDPGVHKKLDSMAAVIAESFNPEALANLTQLLTNIHVGMEQVKDTSGQVAKAVVNQSKEIQNLKQRG